VTGLRVRLVRGGRIVATGALASLDGNGTVRLRARRKLRPGAYDLRLRATDASSRAVRRTLRVRFRR
jgi:hypothetical protein